MTISQRKSSQRRGYHKAKMPTLRSALHQDHQLVADQMQDSSSLDVVTDQISSELLNENVMNNHSGDQVCYTGSNTTSTLFDQSDFLTFPKDQELVNVLLDEGCYESELGLQKRKDLLNELDILVKQWIRSVSLSKGFNWQMAEQVGGKIVTYGSYKLGVVGTAGDMDILCIAPQHIDRNDFFNSLFSQLRKRAKDITELRSLPDAFVPVIKMKFKGIEVDLTFASLYYREIPDDEKFLHSAAMSQLDPRCLRSLNGYRATAEILDLVPDIPNFQVALRAVKLWAKKNGIYGNILGFPGGFSWTILVAKICQMNKGVGPSELVHRFFLTWSSWPWPDPVYLRQPGPQPYLAWNPKVNPQDKTHCMPIITPSTPQINSTNLVTKSTLKCILKRLTCGLEICEDVLSGRDSWNALFRSPSFFQEHEDFLLVTASCEGDQVLWFGLIESQLRHLKDNLEREYGVIAAHIWPVAFTREEISPFTRMWFLAADIHPAFDIASIQQSLHMFQDQLLTKSHSFHSNYNASMNITVHHVTDQEVGNYISEKEMGLPEKKKLSYAAVTLGQTEDQENTIPATASQQQTETTTSNSHPSTIHGSTETAVCSPKIQSSNGMQQSSAINSEELPAVTLLPVSSYATTSESTIYQASHTSISPALAAVYQATLNNYHLPNANYLQPSYQQSYINHSSHLNQGQPTYQEYRRSPSPSAFTNQARGFGNRNSSKPPFPSDQNNSSQVYKNVTANSTYKGSLSLPNLNNKEHSETQVLYYSSAAPNLQMPLQNYLSAPPNYSQINPVTPRRPAIQNLPPVPVHTNSPVPHQNQTPINSPSVNLRNSKHAINSSHSSLNSFPSPISIVNPATLQVPHPNTNIPPPPIHTNHLVNIQMLDRSTPPPTLPLIDRSTPPPSCPPSPLYNVRLLPPNNNHLTIGLDCSCSISDAESTTSRKDNCSDSEDKDRLRSVSNSSDKFPPSSLTRARVTHQEKDPISPMWGMVALTERPPPSPLADTSVPPPPVAPSGSGTTPSFATAMLRPHSQRSNSRRMSLSEIRDTPIPRPVNTVFKQQNIRFSFNSDNVFK